MADKRVLVVYYSRTGTTKGIAATLAEKLEGDLEEIVDRKKRAGVLGFIGGGKDAALKKETRTEPPQHNAADYDLVLLGTPVWAGTMAPAVRTWLTANAGALRGVAFFLTTGRSGIEGTFRNMAELAGQDPKAVLGLRQKDVRKGEVAEAVAGFVAALRADWDTAEMVEG